MKISLFSTHHPERLKENSYSRFEKIEVPEACHSHVLSLGVIGRCSRGERYGVRYVLKFEYTIQSWNPACKVQIGY